MKTGRNLQDVLVELNRQNKAKQDFISPAQGMRLREDGHTFELNHLTTDQQMTFGTTALFHRQVTSALGIPAKYYDLMQSQKPELLAENVNAWFADKPSSYMVRSMDYGAGQVARALLSERYRRIDNMEIATSVLPLFAGNDQYEVMSCEVTENRLYLKVVNHRLEMEVRKGDIVQAGVMISNSEVGLGAVSIQPLVYRLVCTNGMVVNDMGERRHHVGRQAKAVEDSFALYSDETMEAEDKAFLLKLRDTTMAAIDEARFAQVVGHLQESMEVPMGEFVGGRIVPKHCGVWNKNSKYEMLSIVYQPETGNSYISCKSVPAGTALSSEEYWAICAEYSAQVHQLGLDVDADVQQMHTDLAETKQAMSQELSDTHEAMGQELSQAESRMNENLQQTSDNLTTQMNQAKSDLNTGRQELQDAKDMLNKRMDSIAGGKTTDNEILDARVDNQGNTHATLGAAMRSAEKTRGLWDDWLTSIVSQLLDEATGRETKELTFDSTIRTFINLNGTVGTLANESDSHWHTSEMIPVVAGHVYIITASSGWKKYYYAFYDSEENVLSGEVAPDNKSDKIENRIVIAPVGAVNLRITWIQSTTHIGKVEEVTRFLFATNELNGNPENRMSTLETEMDKAQADLIAAATGEQNTLLSAAVVEGEALEFTYTANRCINERAGEILPLASENTNFRVSDPIEVKPGELYAFTVSGGWNKYLYAFYDADDKVVGGYREKTEANIGYADLIRNYPDWELVKVYADRHSATKVKNRPGFQQMVMDAEAKKMDIIICKSVSRFSRNMVDCQQYAKWFRTLGITIIFEEQNIRTDDPTCDFVLSMMAAVAQDESHSISVNVQLAYEKRFARGEYNLGSNRILGYDCEDGKLVPNKDAWIVKEIFKRFLEGQTFREIADGIVAMGARSKTGKDHFSVETIRYMLSNETYVGDKLLQKNPPVDYITKKPDPNREYKPNYLTDDHEAIIDRDTWNKVQEILKQREKDCKAGIYRRSKEHHALYGKVFCGECGAPFVRRTYKGRHGHYKAWNCKERQKGKKGNGCQNVIIKEDELMQAVAEKLGTDALDRVQKVLVYKDRIEVA